MPAVGEAGPAAWGMPSQGTLMAFGTFDLRWSVAVCDWRPSSVAKLRRAFYRRGGTVCRLGIEPRRHRQGGKRVPPRVPARGPCEAKESITPLRVREDKPHLWSKHSKRGVSRQGSPGAQPWKES